MNQSKIHPTPMPKAIARGAILQVYPLASIEPMNANPIHVPNGQEITIIASQNDL